MTPPLTRTERGSGRLLALTHVILMGCSPVAVQVIFALSPGLTTCRFGSSLICGGSAQKKYKIFRCTDKIKALILFAYCNSISGQDSVKITPKLSTLFCIQLAQSPDMPLGPPHLNAQDTAISDARHSN